MTHLTRNIYTRPIQGQHNTAQGGAWSAMCRPGLNASGRYTAPMRLATPTAWRQSSLKSYSPHGNAVGRARHSVLSHTSKREKTNLNRAVPLCILLLFCAFLQEKRGYPTPENAILHPILHPKSPIITGLLGYGCRKCRIFFQNFFRGEERRDIGPGVKEGGLPS